MDWTEKQECVSCCKGGKLLVCNDDGCPILVHKDCMGCKPYFDDSGNFRCPYCVYKKLREEMRELREKAMLAKKALSTFLAKEMGDENHHEPNAQIPDKDKQISSGISQNQLPNLDKNQNTEKTSLQCEETHDTFASKRTNELDKNVNSCRVMVVYEPKSNPVDNVGVSCISSKKDRMKKKVDNRTRNLKRKCDGIVDNQQNTTTTTSIQEETRLTNEGISSLKKMKISCHKKNPFEEFRMDNGDRRKEELKAAEILLSLPGRKSNNDDDSIDNTLLKDRMRARNGTIKGSLDVKIGNQGEFKDSFKKPLSNHPNCNKKGTLDVKIGVVNRSTDVDNRGEFKDSSKQLSANDRITKQRVLWSEKEEDMLKEAVEKFSLLTRKNLPWKKILEFGRHVFDASRNPSDLKDKWRNMAK